MSCKAWNIEFRHLQASAYAFHLYTSHFFSPVTRNIQGKVDMSTATMVVSISAYNSCVQLHRCCSATQHCTKKKKKKMPARFAWKVSCGTATSVTTAAILLFAMDINRLAEEEKSDQPSLKNLKADLNALVSTEVCGQGREGCASNTNALLGVEPALYCSSITH